MNKKISDEEYIQAVLNSKYMAQLIKNLNSRSFNYKSHYARIKRLNVSIEHWIDASQIGNFEKGHKRTPAKPINEMLIEYNPNVKSYDIKRKMIAAKLIENNCSECGLGNIWNEKPISLQLDHINGVNTDYRLENLRLLCPNCHSQTETYCRGAKVFKK